MAQRSRNRGPNAERLRGLGTGESLGRWSSRGPERTRENILPLLGSKSLET